MKSIRRQLIVGLTVAVVAVELLAGALLYARVRAALFNALDAQIAAKAQAIAAGVTIDEGNVHFHPPDSASGHSASDYYQIWKNTGESLSKSPELGATNLPAQANDGVFDITCPGGAAGRAVSLEFLPVAEDKQSIPAVRQFVIVLVENATSVRQSLRILLTSLIAAALITAGGIALVVMLVVRRTLRPLQDVAQAAAAIDARALAFRFPLDTIAPELVPICQKLNELLSRLDTAFKRERRFTSDVAHELRTPISELRSLAEVALRWPDELTTRHSLDDSLQIARQMETIVTTLLALARGSDMRDIVDPQTVRLAGLVERSWQFWNEKAEDKQIHFSAHLAPDVMVRTDPVLLNSILQNLFGNAVQYTPAGGEIRITTAAAGERATLTIENTNPGIDASDLPHLFEPFWRKDSARSDSAHSGLGLALVAEYARILEVDVAPVLKGEALFALTLTLPLASEAAMVQLIVPTSV